MQSFVPKNPKFSSCIENDKLGSVVYTRDGEELWIFETVEEISEYIEYLALNSFEKWWIRFKISFLELFSGN